MNQEEFAGYVTSVIWTFAKSVPNWPHFYIVEEDLPDKGAYKAAREFIRREGRDGPFYDMRVRYYDLDGWTYWSSPLAKPFENQYMLNRCLTEYTYEIMLKEGSLPIEGFDSAELNLSPILNDPAFQELVQEREHQGFSVFDVLGTADYEIRHSNVLAWLIDSGSNHGQGDAFLREFWNTVKASAQLPDLDFSDYRVAREGSGEDEKIDLLLVDKARNWVLTIENKLFSPETGDQLSRYFAYIEKSYEDVSTRLYIYLSPDGISAASEEDRTRWAPVGYSAVCEAVREFIKSPFAPRIKDFVQQYLEHLENNVLRNKGAIERQRAVLQRHKKALHALAHMMDQQSVKAQCNDSQLSVLHSILAIQTEVQGELFHYTKLMMAKHGWKRFSGFDCWITIEIPGVREVLAEAGLLNAGESTPIVFVFDSTPHGYRAQAWVYTRSRFHTLTKGRLSHISPEMPGPDRLVEVFFQRTLITSEMIVRDGLDELRAVIAHYFESELSSDIEMVRQGLVDFKSAR